LAVATEHRVHSYNDDGFFAEDIVAGTDKVMLGRQRELGQFFFINPVLASGLFPVLADSLRAHPIFYAFDGDSATPTAPIGLGSGNNGHEAAAGALQTTLSPAAVRAHLQAESVGGGLGTLSVDDHHGGGMAPVQGDPEPSPATFLRARRDAAMAVAETEQTENPLSANVGATGRWSQSKEASPQPVVEVPAAVWKPDEADL